MSTKAYGTEVEKISGYFLKALWIIKCLKISDGGKFKKNLEILILN